MKEPILCYRKFKRVPGGTWVTQPIERLTLDFGSGHDLRVMGSSPALDSSVSGEPAWDALPLPLPVPLPPHLCSPVISPKKKKFKRESRE